MAATLDGQLVVAISSRALFDFEEENLVFETGMTAEPPPGVQKRRGLHEAAARTPGRAGQARRGFLAGQKAAGLQRRPESAGEAASPAAPAQRVEVVILSRNDPVSGMRVFRSAQHYGLKMQRGTFNRGEAPWRYLQAAARQPVFVGPPERRARRAWPPACRPRRSIPNSVRASEQHPNEVRIAFDGDAVLFSDEAERVFQATGLVAFQQHERDKALQPLLAGPFKPLLEALHRLQQAGTSRMRIRTALVTARSAPAHERAIRTLMEWNIEVDEAMFLGGLAKGEFLREFEPDFFFDDQTGHVDSASQHVPAGHVASGISRTSFKA
jgi:5'-nucleotidase